MASSNVILREPAAIGSTVTLEDLYDRGDHYALLRVALARIADDPDDVGLAVLVCRSYIALGLIGPAREMLSAESRPLGSMPELRSLCEQIVSMPSGAIPWDELRTRFEQNVARIVERHPALSRHEAVFRTIPDRLELYRTRDGNLLVRDRSSGVGHGWLPDFGNTREMVERVSLPHDADALFCDPYVVLYDRFGAMFRRVFEATRKMLLTFSPRIYVVEPDPRMFGVALYTAESVESLCHDRTSVFVGDDWSEDLGAYLRSHPERAVPGYMVDLATPDAVGRAAVEAVSREALESRQRHAAAVVKSVRRLYDALPSGGWARRFEAIRNGGLRLIGFTSRFTTVLQYSMRDLKAAFESRGHTFRIVTEVSDHDLVSPASHVAAVEDVHPDLILNIDHLRSEQGDAFPKNVPFVSWLQDLLPNLTCEEAGRSIGPTDFYIAAGLTELVTRYRYPASQGMAWTMATNEAVYDSEPMPVEALAPHRCDFSYVSNQTEPPHRLHERWLETVRDLRGGSRLLEHVYAALCESWEHDPRNACSRPAMALLAEATRATGIPATTPDNEDQIARRYIHGLTELLFRQRTLEWVADYCDRTGRTLKLYGRGWESHPRFARYACGVAANGEELRAIYQASRINLQITSYGAIHQRLLDGLASGGFFLLRFCRHDVIDKPARRLLAAVEREGLEPDTPYRADAMPDVVDTLEQLPEMFVPDRRPGCFVLPQVELDRYREYAATGFRRVAAAVFDRYRDVAFGTAQEFERLADRYLAGAEDRGCLAASMREVVLQKYTYGALVDALLAFVTERLTAQGV